jgi:hypothetical protein
MFCQSMCEIVENNENIMKLLNIVRWSDGWIDITLVFYFVDTTSLSPARIINILSSQSGTEIDIIMATLDNLTNRKKRMFSSVNNRFFFFCVFHDLENLKSNIRNSKLSSWKSKAKVKDLVIDKNNEKSFKHSTNIWENLTLFAKTTNKLELWMTCLDIKTLR